MLNISILYHLFIMILVIVSSVSITPTNPSGIAGESNITLTCTVGLSGPGTPTISWSGPRSHSPVIPQEGQISFTDSFELERVRESFAGEYTCEASVESSNMSDTVRVSVSG